MMAVVSQSEIFHVMNDPGFYPHPVARIELRETHISKVFLTGDYAYKIKKAVDLGFLDFTTLEKRRNFCRREVILNRRLAPNVYAGVVAITRNRNRLGLAGPGKPVEYAVKMHQLPDDLTMMRLLRKGRIDKRSIQQLTEILADFYKNAAIDEASDSPGVWEAVFENCEENFSQTQRFVGEILDERMFQIIQSATRHFLEKRKRLFSRRFSNGKVRDCHGDLRTGHIYFTDGIKIIDCIEFNDRFRFADVASDLAFLFMDLDFEGQPLVATEMLRSLARHSNDTDLFILIDFYKCYRAFVRVKVNCLRLEERTLGEYERSRLLRETDKYMQLAYQYALNISRPVLWMICGLIASGKSTIAAELGTALKAKVLRSDVVGKNLFGLQPGDSVEVPFGKEIYSKEVDHLVYGKILMLAQEEINKGCSAIMDATFSKLRHRREARRLAQILDARLIIVECVADFETIRQRLLSRETNQSISDARIHHLKQFRELFEPLSREEERYCIRVNTERPLEENTHRILAENYERMTESGRFAA